MITYRHCGGASAIDRRRELRALDDVRDSQRAHALSVRRNSGILATAQAKVQHKALRQQTPRIGFEDPGEVVRHEARAILAEARRQVARAGDEAATALAGATEPAPQKRGFWDDAADVAADVGAALANAGGYAINGLASFGNAILNHPEGVAAIVAGAAAATAGAGGEVGGLALDATGVGAIAGVPINVASAGLIVAGVTTAAAGAGVLFSNAAGDDAVHPASTSNPGSGANQYAPKDGFRGRTGFTQDEIEHHQGAHG